MTGGCEPCHADIRATDPCQRGRKRLFNAAIHALRMRIERTFCGD
jgi:hypothetical protein